MADKKPPPKPANKAGYALQAADGRAAVGSANENVQLVRLGEVLSSLWLPTEYSSEERSRRLDAAMEALKDIGPKDGQEGMLAAQMVATHSAAMECLRRAMIPGQLHEGRDLNLKHANKLLQTYARQMEVLDKHRGKGQQKIVVEHVTVEAGGQAIVGNVSAGAARPAGPPPPALADQSGNEILMPAPRVTEKAKANRRKAPGTDG